MRLEGLPLGNRASRRSYVPHGAGRSAGTIATWVANARRRSAGSTRSSSLPRPRDRLELRASHDAERDLLQRLSVFAGGFDLDAAEAVAPTFSDTTEIVASLVNKSFLVPREIDGFVRYSMLESIREFAAARLDAVRRRIGHAEQARDVLRRARGAEDKAIWGGPAHRQALDRLEIDLANFRSALAWLEASGDGPPCCVSRRRSAAFGTIAVTGSKAEPGLPRLYCWAEIRSPEHAPPRWLSSLF